MQLVVPVKLSCEFVRHAHEGITGGHLAWRRTADQVLRRGYWVGWRRYVNQFCRR